MEQKKSKQEALNEALGTIATLTERVRYHPGELFPSQIQNELDGAQALVTAGFGNTPPPEWEDVIRTTKIFLFEAAKPQRIAGCCEKLHGMIEEQTAAVIAGEQRRARERDLLSQGKAATVADWKKMTPQQSTDFFNSGGILID